MLGYGYYYEDESCDTCDIIERQRAYVIALGLTSACGQINK